MAYGTQRTMVLKSKGWRYHRAGWEEVFMPVSDTCTDTEGAASVSNWPGRSKLFYHVVVIATHPVLSLLEPD